MTLDELAVEIRAINNANGWSVFEVNEISDNYKLPAILALIHSELSEALEAFRKRDDANLIEELADVQIRLLDLAGGLTADFEKHVLRKMAKNRTRGHKHGGKRI